MTEGMEPMYTFTCTDILKTQCTSCRMLLENVRQLNTRSKNNDPPDLNVIFTSSFVMMSFNTFVPSSYKLIYMTFYTKLFKLYYLSQSN